MSDLKFRIELNVLNHLGIGLYSSTPSVVTEIIANAWDADASEVDVTLDPEGDLIRVEDDGHGMSAADLGERFLKVGYARRLREPNGQFSRSGRRRVMGRKGIGKLAMFSLANRIEVVSRAVGGEVVGFHIDVAELRRKLQSSGEEMLDYPVQIVAPPADFAAPHGTRITLTSLNTRINKTETFLRPRLARRFGVFGKEFGVKLNGVEVTRRDAGFYEHLQFLWHFDDDTRMEVQGLATSLATVADETGAKHVCSEPIEPNLSADFPGATVRGFIATVDTPARLGAGDESLNKISIFANGRVFQEDVLPEVGDARYFTSYIVGEVHADFLDDDDTDRATASRESIKRDDERFQALRAHLQACLRRLRDRWDELRRELGYSKTTDANPAVGEWIASLRDPRDRKAADRLMTSIGNLTVSNDDDRNRRARLLLYRSAIVGFEKLRVRKQLDRLDAITDVLSPEFQTIFSSLDDIEESQYLDITRTRLEIIRRFEQEIVVPEKLEKVAQFYLFEHLWLLDPTWGRVTGSEVLEWRLTEELRRTGLDDNDGARLDIAYRLASGRHVIIELKRPGKHLPAGTLRDQGVKYKRAVEQYYREHPDALTSRTGIPPIDVYLLVSTRPEFDQTEDAMWMAAGLEVMTYEGLIVNARKAYQEYLDVRPGLGRIEKTLAELEAGDAGAERDASVDESDTPS